MAKQIAKRKKVTNDPYDGVFALKLALYLILGTLWLKLSNDQTIFPIPIGLIIGMVLASHEHFKLDRKIDYAVLLIAALIGFWAPFGLYISF
jgi:hypothetical protein